jgi:hypothetical protein
MNSTLVIRLALLAGLVALAACSTNVPPGPDAAGCYNQSKHHGRGLTECLEEVAARHP